MEDEYKPNNSIYNGTVTNGDPAQEAAKIAMQRAWRSKLPKFELLDGEEFFISENELKNINTEYFLMLDEMKKGLNSGASEEMYSFMQSVVFASYKSKIIKKQRDAAEAAIPLDVVKNIKAAEMTPGYYRKWKFGRKRPNEALLQCRRLANIEIAMEFSARQEEIAKREEFIYGEPTDTTDLVSAFVYTLPKRMRKRWLKQNSDFINRLFDIFIIQVKQNAERAALEAVERARKESETEEATETPQDAPEASEELAAEEPEAADVDELEELYELEEEPDIEPTESEPQEGEIPPVYYNDVSALSFAPQSSEAEPGEESEAEDEPGEGDAVTVTENED